MSFSPAPVQVQASQAQSSTVHLAKGNEPNGPEDASRSVIIIVENQTEMDFIKKSEHLDGGKWSDGLLPPEVIRSGETKKFASQSHGFMTGTEGDTVYEIFGDTTVKFYWDNPWAGDNEYKATIDGPDSSSYDSSKNVQGWDNSTVTFTIKRTS